MLLSISLPKLRELQSLGQESTKYGYESGEYRVKVGSHDPTSVQLSLKSLLCMIENVGVHTIQFSQPIKNWWLLWSNRMEIGHVQFSSNT